MAGTQVYTPDLEELILCPEGTITTPAWGVPVTANPILCIPEVGTLVTTVVGAPLQGNFSVGRAFSNFDRRSIVRNATIAFNTWFRANGEVPFLIASMLGLASDTNSLGTGGSELHTMAPALLTTQGLSYTGYHDTGDGQAAATKRMLAIAGARPSQLDFSFAADSAMGVAVQMEALMATNATTIPTVPAIAANNIPTMGYTGTINLPSLAGAAYSGIVITSASFSLQRTIGMVKGITNAAPGKINDIVPGPIMVTGSFNFEYNGLLAASIHDDFLAQKKQGTGADLAHTLTAKFIDDSTNGNYWSIGLWPFLFDDLTLSTNQTYLEGSVTLGPFNDLATAVTGPGLGAATSPVSVVVQNDYSGKLG